MNIDRDALFDSTTATEPELAAMTALVDLQAEWGEPDWSVLEDRRGKLPEFPEQVLSAPVRDYLERAARGAGVTFAHVAVPLLSIASGITGTARRVQASRSFIQPISCWCALVGFSGTGKTPGIAVTTRALVEIERFQRDKLAEKQRQHETKVEAAKAAHKAWLALVEEAISAGHPPPTKPVEAAKLGPFVRPRLWVSDVTIERVAVLIQSRPAGLPLILDELAGLFSNMGRYSQGSDREFWLEAWNGNPYTIERIGREPIALDRLLVSVTGGFQPDKLTRAFEGDNDGMYARICFAWPSEVGYRPLSDEVGEVEPEIFNALSRLVRLGEADADEGFVTRSIPLSSDAAAVFEQFRQFLHDTRSGLEDREGEWWSKGAAQVLRIAGTVAMLDWSWNGGPEPSSIERCHLDGAVVLWRDYFWPHSRAAIRQMGTTRRRSLERRVLIWLRKLGGKRTQVSIKDLRRELFGHMLNAKESEALLDSLAASGWLKKQSMTTGGRPSHRWLVNPMLQLTGLSAESAESAGSGWSGSEGSAETLSALSALPARQSD